MYVTIILEVNNLFINDLLKGYKKKEADAIKKISFLERTWNQSHHFSRSSSPTIVNSIEELPHYCDTMHDGLDFENVINNKLDGLTADEFSILKKIVKEVFILNSSLGLRETVKLGLVEQIYLCRMFKNYFLPRFVANNVSLPISKFV